MLFIIFIESVQTEDLDLIISTLIAMKSVGYFSKKTELDISLFFEIEISSLFIFYITKIISLILFIVKICFEPACTHFNF